MSLAEMEAYERERQLRREKIRRIASWAPPVAAVLMLTMGGLSVWSASSGHEADQAEVEALVDELEDESEEADAELETAWVEALEHSSTVRVQRMQNDGELMHELVREAVEEEGDISTIPATTSDDEALAQLGDLVDDGVPGLAAGKQAELGAFDPVLVDMDVGAYSYFAYVDVFDAEAKDDGGEDGAGEDDHAPAAATLSVAWITEVEGAITHVDAHWTEESPEHS